MQYYASDFGAFLGPMAGLKIGKRDPEIKAQKPLVIHRLPPYSSSDGRGGFCDGIGRSVYNSAVRPWQTSLPRRRRSWS